ncbi:MAG: hypothetical protein BAJATHORv1_70001 [Candidatus Thorarchaeota archaeon]|nr:MAG: hypothetical protein BAJATHORv1_70001 [Candidatus Thorarchaeota archaeon]
MIAQVMEELEDTGDQDIRLLASIPGIGLPSAAVLKAEIGTIERFKTPENLSSYAGLAPRVHQSGSVLKTGRVSRRCNHHIKTTMYLVSQVCARYGPEHLRGFHQTLKAKKGYQVATVALARRMMVIIWKMLKTGKSFQSVHQEELLERKRKKIRYETRRLKRLRQSYGVKEFREMIRQVMQHDQTILSS